MLAPSAIMAVAFPRLARRGDKEGWTRLEVQLIGLLGALGIVIAVGLYALSDPIVRFVFGGDFAHAGTLLRILAVSTPALFLNFALTFFLFARGSERAYLLIVGAMVVLNVALNLVFVPRFGAAGSAWATLATEAALATGSIIALSRPPPSIDDPARSARAPRHRPRGD
jgi:PST family polysaccharide transporter